MGDEIDCGDEFKYEQEDVCDHDWQPEEKFDSRKPNPGTVHFPMFCSKCGAKHTKIVDVLEKNRKIKR